MCASLYCACGSVSDELVDWDPWQPAAADVMNADEEDEDGPHFDDPDFNVSPQVHPSHDIHAVSYTHLTLPTIYSV